MTASRAAGPRPARIPAPHQLLVAGLAGVSVAVVALAVAAYRADGKPVALAVALGLTLWWALTGLQIVLSRRAARRAAGGAAPRPARSTGRVLSAVPGPVGSWSGTGGASVSGALGRINAVRPMARLDVETGRLRLAVAGGRALGLEPVHAEPAADPDLFPVRGPHRGARGLAVCTSGRPPAYFWTGDTAEVLAALEAAGFAVSWEERRLQVWSA